MLNYKRLSFIFLFVGIFLIATDTELEKQSRKNLLSLFDVVVEEGSQVTDTAPSSFLDTIESSRIVIYNFLSDQAIVLRDKSESSKGLISFLLNIGSYIVLIFKFISNYVITFYPFIIAILYFFFTSRFFRKDEFSYDNY